MFRVRINFSKLYHEKLYIPILVSPEGPLWLSLTLFRILFYLKFYLESLEKPVIYKFFKDFTNYRKRTGKVVVFSCRLLLNTATAGQSSQYSGKKDSFRHILKSSASVYKSSGPQFFRTPIRGRCIWGIKACYHFLNHLGSYIKILCSLRLDLEGKTG